MVSPPARRAHHTYSCSFASRRSFPHLPDLEEMSIRVMEKGPRLFELLLFTDDLGTVKLAVEIGVQVVSLVGHQGAEWPIGRRDPTIA